MTDAMTDTPAMHGPFTSARGQSGLPRWFHAVFDTVVAGLTAGRLDIRMPDGRVFRAEGPKPGPHGEIRIRDESFFARMVRDGEMAFAETYMEGGWDTPDLQAVLDVALMSNDGVGRTFAGAAIARNLERLRHWLRGNTKRQARRNIAAHYDLGNEFYAKWLDETMTYSSALFERPEETMAEAQARKYAAVCDGIGAGQGGHVLEIGCGWGGFAEYAARERGLKVTGLTISREQHDFAKRRIFEAGLAERVDIVMRDYRDERGRYDGVASIEMFEAVGEKYWPVYFRALHDRLKDDARATLQVITVDERLFPSYRKSVDFIQKYIFPGGMLPSPGELSRQARAAGLERLESIEFGASYSATLRRWRRSFEARWDEIAPLGFDERFRRMWDFYLASCAACFMAGTTDVTQVTFGRA